MAKVKDYNALNNRKIVDRVVVPAVIALVNGATVGTDLFIRVKVTDPSTIIVEDGDVNFDTNGYAAICNGLSNSTSDMGVVVAKSAGGVITTTT